VVNGGPELGIKVQRPSIDWKALGKRRASVSKGLSDGVKMLWDKNKVELIEGEAALTADGNGKGGETTHEAKAVVLATGSVAMPIPETEFAGRIVDTWGAWSLPEQPAKIAVVGAGASGAAIASGGDTATITIRNDDPIDHEWLLGDVAMHERHRAGTEPVHAARPNEVTIPALSSRTTTITFPVAITLTYMCHLPGHEQYGMVGTLTAR